MRFSYILAKAEIAENSEGKEIKNRKVHPSTCFNRTISLSSSHSVVNPARNLATQRLPTGPRPRNPYEFYSRKTLNIARKSTTPFSISSSNPRKVPRLKMRMKRGRGKILAYIRSMGMKRTMEKAMRWSRKEGSIKLLYV